MRHKSLTLSTTFTGPEVCVRCGAKRDKKHGIEIPNPANRLYPEAGPITHGWVLNGRVLSPRAGCLQP